MFTMVQRCRNTPRNGRQAPMICFATGRSWAEAVDTINAQDGTGVHSVGAILLQGGGNHVHLGLRQATQTWRKEVQPMVERLVAR
ncbi:MAG: hypothetical protein IJ849_12835 [Selenomonadaceae bacterium]|nr:hypothetical protein [Selenomonadaceae bacterium]